MNILLTGSSGFIGKKILESFTGRYTMFAPTSRELDLTDEQEVTKFFANKYIDIVIHSALRPGHRNAQDTSNQLYINTRMFFNLLRNADCFGKMIFIGSGAVYDIRYPISKVSEEYFDRHVPADEHGFSKYIIAKHLQGLKNIVELRIFGIFGEYEDYAIRFISNAICKTLFNLPITLRQNRKLDYLYINDLIPVLEYFIHNRWRHTSYNVTPDCAVDLLSIANIVKARSGKDLPIIVGQKEIGLEYSGDNCRLKEEIVELTLTPIIEAIDHLYSWYEENIHLIDRKKLMVDK